MLYRNRELGQLVYKKGVRLSRTSPCQHALRVNLRCFGAMDQKHNPRNKLTHAITDCSPLLKAAVKKGIFDNSDVLATPVAQFYDMDLWDAHLANCKNVFGPTVLHCMAIKSCSISKLVRHAYDKFGFGVECASIGEVLHAIEHCKIPKSHVVFDSPAKTKAEVEFSIREGIHCNFDNFVEYSRAKEYIASSELPTAPVGFRINPLVGAGTIAALSVSTSESKFGTPITEKNALLKAYVESPWMNSVHVHVGSGGMGVKVLTDGIKVVVDFALEVNKAAGKQQITHIDIGGGLPANYASDTWAADAVPTYTEYANHLKKEVPQLFSGEFQVLTEFGQSVFAKSGILASRIEWCKGPDGNVAIIHFGGDVCPRQVYTTDHKRRIEVYQSDGTPYPADVPQKKSSVGGPLCFQGDFLAKDIDLPAKMKPNDLCVMKDTGASTFSMFSRHCSRLAPPVYGYRCKDADATEVSDIFELKPRETVEQLSAFWGKL